MAVKATASTRSPRGTKMLMQAFFSAADEIPDGQRGAVVKAALTAIRDQLKGDREKAKAAKEKLKAGKASPSRRAKALAAAPKRQAAGSTGKKAGVKRPKKVVTPAAKPPAEISAT